MKKVIKKAQAGTTVKGEMTGKSYPKTQMDSWQKQQAAALTKQAASSQKPSTVAVPKKKSGGAVKKTMKSGGKMSKCKNGCY